MSRRCFVAMLLIAIAGAACGKRGAPLPPLVRMPAPVGEMSAARIGDEVYVRFKVPTANVDGQTPADVARVEVYAITANREPTGLDDAEDLRKQSTLIGSEQVRPPAPPPAPAKPGEPEPPPVPPGPGVDQGATVVVREQLTDAARTAIELRTRETRRAEDEVMPLPGPIVAQSDTAGPKRYYYAVGVSRSGRYGPAQPFIPIPLGPTSGTPSAPSLAYDETTLTLKWTPPADARGAPITQAEDVLPSRSLIPEVPRTMYDVYEVPRPPQLPREPSGADAPRAPETLEVPAPINQAPIAELELKQPITAFGEERCFFVRPVDIIDGFHVRGPASPQACIELTDKFPPAPPGSLRAVASAGTINLIWDPSPASDVAGYVVLRAETPDATLTPLMKDPMTETTWVDRDVRAGVTYAYAVIAVDKAGNRSAESNRVEETARP